MTISQLLAMPIDSKIGGGFILTVKKTKKSIKLPSGQHVHTVVLFDKTGEILADFEDIASEGYNPLQKNWQIAIIVAEIQAADATGRQLVDQTGKKLYVRQYSLPSVTEPPDIMNFSDSDKIVRGKIKTWLIAAKIQSGKPVDRAEIDSLVDYAME